MKIKQKKLTIRFYEELNDFLPSEMRKKRFTHNFIDRTSVKDLIESLGVPHTEVDLILVNGKSVSFKYVVKDNDDISVYPVFESFDISDVQHLRPKPLRKPKFICDVHLGKLTKIMRMLGFDVYYKNDLSDDKIVELSLSEKRTILTRDVGLLKRKEVTHGYYIRSDDPQKQTSEVIDKFHLHKQINLFTICLDCGNKLVKIAKKDIVNLLPDKVKEQHNKFLFCNTCKKIYWAGSHVHNMNLIVQSFKKLLNV